MTLSIDEIKANREAWYADLLFGKYKQGQGWLRDGNDRHCCLGVLCRTLHPDESAWVVNNTHFVFDGIFSTMPPLKLLQQVGLSTTGMHSLMSKNDSGEWSFADLVTNMQTNPHKYFLDGTF